MRAAGGNHETGGLTLHNIYAKNKEVSGEESNDAAGALGGAKIDPTANAPRTLNYDVPNLLIRGNRWSPEMIRTIIKFARAAER